MTAAVPMPHATRFRGMPPAILASATRSRRNGIGYVALLLERALAVLTSQRAVVVEIADANGLLSIVSKAGFMARVAAAQARVPADLVIYNHIGLARAQRWVPRPVRRPYAVFVHGVEVWEDGYARGRMPALTEASLVIANSSFTANRVRSLYPQLGEVAPCPLALLDDDPAASTELADQTLLACVRPRSALILGRMSRGERYKGHDALLECWDQVRSQVAGAQLVIARTGDDVGRLRAEAARLGVLDDVLFCGAISEATKRALMQRVAAFVMPSKGEGFGLVYLEAMRGGLPCIGSVHDAAGDVIIHGETGLLVDQDHPGALADALVALLGNANLARAYGAAGRERFEREFTFARFCERLGVVLHRAGHLEPGPHA